MDRFGNTPLQFTASSGKWSFLDLLVPIYYRYLPNLVEDWLSSKIILPEFLRPIYRPIVMRIAHILEFPSQIVFMLIRRSISSNHIEIFQFILEKFPHIIDAFSPLGHNSLLFEAIRSDRIDSVRLLISMGANPYKRNQSGQNAFDLCYHLRRVEIYESMTQLCTTIVPSEPISNGNPSSFSYIDVREEEDTITIEEMDDGEGGSDNSYHISPFTQILYNTLLNSTRL